MSLFSPTEHQAQQCRSEHGGALPISHAQMAQLSDLLTHFRVRTS